MRRRHELSRLIAAISDSKEDDHRPCSEEGLSAPRRRERVSLEPPVGTPRTYVSRASTTVAVGKDLDGLLERLKVLGGQQHRGGLAVHHPVQTRSCCLLTGAISLDRCGLRVGQRASSWSER
jgi:hypothetical protein